MQTENRTVTKIRESESWLFKNICKVKKTLERLTEEEREDTKYQIRNETRYYYRPYGCQKDHMGIHISYCMILLI